MTHDFDFHGFSRYSGGAFARILPVIFNIVVHLYQYSPTILENILFPCIPFRNLEQKQR